jgi:Na+/H+ antiporter NhaD/arsenite permease-like protein
MRRLIASLDAEDRLVGAGAVLLTLAGLLVHPALGVAIAGCALIASGVALALRETEQ